MLFFRSEHIRIGRNKYTIVQDYGQDAHLVQIYSWKYRIPGFLYYARYYSSTGYLRKMNVKKYEK